MKKFLLMVGLLVPLWTNAQPSPAPAATQEEVNAGTVPNKYVSPKTLGGYTLVTNVPDGTTIVSDENGVISVDAYGLYGASLVTNWNLGDVVIVGEDPEGVTNLQGSKTLTGLNITGTFTGDGSGLTGVGSTNFFGSNVIASIVASTNSFTLDAAGVALTEEQTYHWNADLDRYTNSVNESVVVWESDSEYWCVTNQFSVPDIISIPFTYLAESGIEAYWLDTNVQQSTLIGSFTSDTNLHLVAYADDYRGAFPVPSSEAFINVKMPPFSAAGDGVTDDAPAIQSALEYAASGDTETSEVYLPEGDYRLLSTITLPSNTDITNRNTSYTRKITLRGQGSSSRMLWYQTNGNAIEFIKLVGANKTNALFQVTFADFALWGPLQWGLAHPAGQVFNYTFASNVTARGFAVGNTDPSGPGAVSAVAVGWTWKNVLVSGFYDGMTITNADYTLIDKPMVESFSHCGIIFAGSTEPRIHGGGVGTVSIFGCSWTNDFAGIVFVKDVHGFPCYNPMVDNVEGGYQSRLIYRRECGTLTVNACASDSIHFAFIDTDAAQMFAYNSWCAGAPFIYTPTSLYASYYSFPWTFVNCTTTEGYPFIVNGSGVTAFSSMPNIFRNSGPEETLTYNPFGNPALKTAWKTNMLMQCGTNYYYLPRVGQALSADTDTLMGRELYVITNGLPIYTASNFVTFGSLALPARTARAWGVSIGDDAGIQYYYPLKRFLASDQLTVRVALALYTGYQPQTNGGRIAYSFNVRGMTSTNSVQNTAVTGYITLTTNTIATNLTVRLNTLAGAAPFYNWNTEARFLWVYLHGLTNDISISDVSVTYNEPFTPPPVSTGFRLPDGP